MPSHRARRPLFVAAGALVLLVALYAALGYLAAPSLLRNALVQRAAAAGYELRIDKLRTNPFSLVADAYGVQLSRNEKPLLEARGASLDLGWPSLWRHAWVLDRLALEAPVLYALPPLAKAGEEGAGAWPAVVIRSLQSTDGTVRLASLPRLEKLQLQARDFSTLEGHGNGFQASATLASGGCLRAQGKLSALPFQVSGTMELADAVLAEAWRYLPAAAGKAPPGRLSGSLDYRYAEGRLSLSKGNVRAALDSGGELRVAGSLAVLPLAGELELHAEAIPMALAQPLLAGPTKLELVGGTLSGQGKLRLGKDSGYQGSLAVREARIDGPQGELAGWQSLATQSLRLAFSPFSLRADEVAAEAPRVRVAIGAQGDLNLAFAFADGKSDARGEVPDVSISRLRIEAGRLDFTDRSLESPFSTTVQELTGALTELSTKSRQPARIQLAGRVGEYGEARVQGAIDLTAPSTRTNVALLFRNLALADFTPYAVKFAGYRIRAGRLNADLRYRVREGRLVGSNRLVFDKLQLGEKVETASALDLPIDLAVALLTDAQGRINLAIPVSGDLRNPQFDLGGLIAKALRNTLGRVVSAPFRLIASLLGRGGNEKLDEVRFDPGSASLSPPEEETIAALAKALGERPRLKLSIEGGYDPQADGKALARAELLRELAQRAGYGAAAGGSAPSGIDPRDPKIVHAAERLFLSRGGQAIDLSALEPRRPGYGRRLLDVLAEKTNLEGDSPPALARERAETVREALVGRGVDRARIEIAGAVEAEASGEGVPTRLALHGS
ncbi:MAG TPA: DUF748 domain-containing protein [Burkholderiales bacterium]|nr:DUF748 domain-containing protein [Burkholderiales bacterium]